MYLSIDFYPVIITVRCFCFYFILFSYIFTDSSNRRLHPSGLLLLLQLRQIVTMTTQCHHHRSRVGRVTVEGTKSSLPTPSSCRSLPVCSSTIIVWAWLSIGRDLRSCSTSGPVSTWMGDRTRAGKPSRSNQPHMSTQPSTLCGTVK